MSENNKQIKSSLKFLEIDTMKQYLVLFIFMLNFFWFLTVFFESNVIINIILIPLIVLLNFYIIYFFIDTRSKQKKFILFMGLFYLFTSIIIEIFSLKLLYSVLTKSSVRLLLTSISILSLIILHILIYKNTSKKLHGNITSKKIRMDKIVIVVVFFILITRLLVINLQIYKYTIIHTSFIILMISLVFGAGASNIYRYFYIKRL